MSVIDLKPKQSNFTNEQLQVGLNRLLQESAPILRVLAEILIEVEKNGLPPKIEIAYNSDKALIINLGKPENGTGEGDTKEGGKETTPEEAEPSKAE